LFVRRTASGRSTAATEVEGIASSNGGAVESAALQLKSRFKTLTSAEVFGVHGTAARAPPVCVNAPVVGGFDSTR
jgi:hypothetical protein